MEEIRYWEKRHRQINIAIIGVPEGKNEEQMEESK